MSKDKWAANAQERLVTWLESLQQPTSFFRGSVQGKAGLPDNILLFPRMQARVLVQSARQSYHHRYVLILALRGQGMVVLNRQSLLLQDGQALLIRPLQFHHYTDFKDEQIRWLFITFEGSLSGGFSDWKNAPAQLSSTGWELLSAIAKQWGSRGDDGRNADEMPYALGWLLHHLAKHSPKVPRPALRQADMQTQLLYHKVENWLQVRPPEHWYVQAIAADCGISERHLRRRFLQETTLNIGRFLQEQKLMRALNHLRGGATVTEAAEAAGYSSVYIFSRAFRNLLGHSPSEYLVDRSCNSAGATPKSR